MNSLVKTSNMDDKKEGRKDAIMEIGKYFHFSFGWSRLMAPRTPTNIEHNPGLSLSISYGKKSFWAGTHIRIISRPVI